MRENKPMLELALALGFVEDREGEAAVGDDDVRFVLELRPLRDRDVVLKWALDAGRSGDADALANDQRWH